MASDVAHMTLKMAKIHHTRSKTHWRVDLSVRILSVVHFLWSWDQQYGMQIKFQPNIHPTFESWLLRDMLSESKTSWSFSLMDVDDIILNKLRKAADTEESEMRKTSLKLLFACPLWNQRSQRQFWMSFVTLPSTSFAWTWAELLPCFWSHDLESLDSVLRVYTWLLFFWWKTLSCSLKTTGALRI